jgi:hypothetical protein
MNLFTMIKHTRGALAVLVKVSQLKDREGPGTPAFEEAYQFYLDHLKTVQKKPSVRGLRRPIPGYTPLP